MTTGTDPLVDVHPLLAVFIRKLLSTTPFVVSDVKKPSLAIGGTWEMILNNGTSLSVRYGKGVRGCHWYATYRKKTYNFSIPEAVEALQKKIVEGVEV